MGGGGGLIHLCDHKIVSKWARIYLKGRNMLTNNTPYSHSDTKPEVYTVICTFTNPLESMIGLPLDPSSSLITFTTNILLFFVSFFVITQYLSRSLRQHLNTTSTLILERLNELFTAEVGEDQ